MSQLEKSLLFKAKDKTAIIFFVLNLLFGIWICLATSQKVNADIQTLWLVSLTCSFLALNWFARREDLAFASLAIIPIALRTVLTSKIFTSWSMIFENLKLLLWIIGIWIIVAFAEETFRATMTTFSQTIVKNIKNKIVKQYKTVFDVYFSSIKYLAITTFLAIIAIVLNTHYSLILFYMVIWAVIVLSLIHI